METWPRSLCKCSPKSLISLLLGWDLTAMTSINAIKGKFVFVISQKPELTLQEPVNSEARQKGKWKMVANSCVQSVLTQVFCFFYFQIPRSGNSESSDVTREHQSAADTRQSASNRSLMLSKVPACFEENHHCALTQGNRKWCLNNWRLVAIKR